MTSSGWRVKLYQLAKEGAWIDHGTGNVGCKYIQNIGGLAVVVINENDNSTLLQSKVQHEDIYERQGESIIMWREAEPGGDIDYALSFQDTAGCQAIWEAIGEVQSQHNNIPKEFMRMSHVPNNTSVRMSDNDDDQGPTLPEFNVENISEIRDRLSVVHPSLRDAFICQILEKDMAYIRKLLAVFADLEDLEKTESLVKIAEIVRSLLFMNDASILEFVLQEEIFLKIAGALEYDPALKTRGDYRDYLTRRAKHVEVIPIENPALKSEIGLLFRMKYLRDIMLRPTIEDTGVSTINSMIGFTTADVCSKVFEDIKYMSRMLKIIKPSVDVSAICPDAWSPDYSTTTSSRAEMEKPGAALKELLGDLEDDDEDEEEEQCNMQVQSSDSTEKTHHDPQQKRKRKRDDADAGMESCSSNDESEVSASTASTVKASSSCGGAPTSSNGLHARKTMAIRFVRELFFLSRSLILDRRSELYSKMLNQLKSQFFEVCLSILADPYSTETDRLLISESLACVAVICPSYLRQYILEGPVPSLPTHLSASNRPPPPQLTGSAQSAYASSNTKCLLYVIIRRVVSENDSAIIEQLGDTIKVLIDPERLDRQEKDRFLGVFYDFYIHWLVTPFVEPRQTDQFDPTEEFEAKSTRPLASATSEDLGSASYQDVSAISTSRRFLFDILSLCVHGHTYRMKYFIMRNSLISRVLRVFDSPHRHLHISAVKFIRMILNMKDEFYYRHIIKLDLFRPIMLVLKGSSKRDNLVTSSISELIEFIRTEGIRSIADYIVEKHADCFEGIHAGLLERLMIRYEQGQDRDRETRRFGERESALSSSASDDGYGPMPLGAAGVSSARQALSRPAGRKANDRDNEDAYFFTDDDDDGDSTDSSSSSGSGVDVNLDNEKVGRGRSGSLGGLSSILLDDRPMRMGITRIGDGDIVHSGLLTSSRSFGSFVDVQLDAIPRGRQKHRNGSSSSSSSSVSGSFGTAPEDPFALISSYAEEDEIEAALTGLFAGDGGDNIDDSPRSPPEEQQKRKESSSLEEEDGDEDGGDDSRDSPPLPPLKSKFELDDDDAGLGSFVRRPTSTTMAAGRPAAHSDSSTSNGNSGNKGGLTFRLKSSNLGGPKTTIKFVSKGPAENEDQLQ